MLVLNFGLSLTNHSHFFTFCENLLENLKVSVGLSTFTPSSMTWKGSHVQF